MLFLKKIFNQMHYLIIYSSGFSGSSIETAVQHGLGAWFQRAGTSRSALGRPWARRNHIRASASSRWRV